MFKNSKLHKYWAAFSIFKLPLHMIKKYGVTSIRLVISRGNCQEILEKRVTMLIKCS